MTLKIGIIGMGFMGATHLSAWRLVPQADIAAVCVRNPEITKAKQGNIETGASDLDLDGINIYTDLEEMLARESLDAVSITLPTHLHKETSIRCLEAGLHVLCEKPMALNDQDCREMIETANASGKILMVAQCIRFWPEYAWLKETLESGALGRILAADFQRLTYAPSWSGETWFSDTAKSGGISLDLHIHDLDFVLYLLGKPESTISRKSHFPNGTTAHIQTWLDYPEELTVSATASWLMPESFGFQMSFNVVFEKGLAAFDGKKLTIYRDHSDPDEPSLPQKTAYQSEVSHFADLISGRAHHPVISPGEAAESVRIALTTEQS
ncbi:Gfo/Idh/MocA family protein [Luteolibacter algae]|uniref:Gfo/Idh/MocA family protein n=1 Tax=Luteolibacter algae TaxID=454151 RepID=A0ABW5D9U2_9BACT